MQHPEPALGSSQIKILRVLKEAKGFVLLPPERAVDKLWDKGYIRWQASPKGKEWEITKSGLEALERKG